MPDSRTGDNHAVRTDRLISLLLRWLLLALSVWLAAKVAPGIRLEGELSILAVAAILGLLNLYLRPLLFWLTLPFTLLTLGLFLIVVNALILLLTSWIAGRTDAIDFEVDGLGPALLGAIVISVVGMLVRAFLDPDRLARHIARRGF